jgi:hypothetical protein
LRRASARCWQYGYDGDPARPVPFIADRFIGLGIAAHRLLDRAFDIVLGHVLSARILHGETQSRILVGLGKSGFCSDGNLAGKLREQARADRILLALAVHDVLEL